MNGASFRRQTPIGPYIADFVCHKARDGGQRYSLAGEARDARRDAFLAARGFRVLRFSNYDVMTNRAGVLETIAAAVPGAGPLPNPPPASGGGNLRALPS